MDEQSRAVNRPSEGRVRYYYPTSEDLHVTLGEPLHSIKEALVSADWFQDHDAVQPGELLNCAASPEKISCADRRVAQASRWTRKACSAAG